MVSSEVVRVVPVKFLLFRSILPEIFYAHTSKFVCILPLPFYRTFGVPLFSLLCFSHVTICVRDSSMSVHQGFLIYLIATQYFTIFVICLTNSQYMCMQSCSQYFAVTNNGAANNLFYVISQKCENIYRFNSQEWNCQVEGCVYLSF